MDLGKLFAIARKHWVLMTVGVVAGVLVAAATLYKIDPAAPMYQKLRERSYTVYQSDMQLMVDDPTFGVGRAGSDPTQPDTFGKTIQLAQTYSNLVVSDAVKRAAEESVGPFPGTVTSEAMENSPIFQVTLTGSDPKKSEAYGHALAGALSAFLVEEQAQRDVPKDQRITVRMIAAPNDAQPVQSRQWEMALVAFLIPVGCAYGVALLRFRNDERKKLGL